MKTVAVIPARYASVRLPGKPLADICGKPMVWWVYHKMCGIDEIDGVCVATDDRRIGDVCEKFGMPYMMTESVHPTAANRLWEVSERLEADFYLQINGDEPLISTEAVKAAIPEKLPKDREYGINIITEIKDPVQLMDPSNIKVVFDDSMRALYMSRTPIPFPFRMLNFSYYKHVGIIGYNKKMLDFYANSGPGRLEAIEGIDTLRFIDYGKELRFKIVENCETLSVDTQKDLDEVRIMMRRQNPKNEGGH